MNSNTEPCISPLSLYLSQGRELAPHLVAALEKLSTEHLSGIPLAQQDTPMMKQFIAVKNQVVDALVFFRMGDFFELFGSDAVIVADICGLTLTSRDRHSDTPVPMAGVPVVSYRATIKKCVLAGFKVAVVDQVEDPRFAKGIVKREIVRIATPAVPGDLGEDESTNNGDATGCYLAAVLCLNNKWIFSYVDVSTGAFKITHDLTIDALAQELSTILPREIITKSDQAAQVKQIAMSLLHKPTIFSTFEPWIFRSEADCHSLINDFFGVNGASQFGIHNIAGAVPVIAGILSYLKNTQRDVVKNIKSVEIFDLLNCLKIDDATKRHLDFFTTANGEKRGSLFWFLNQCATSTGSRLLMQRLHYPFYNINSITTEHNLVASLISNDNILQIISQKLRSTADLERLLSRVAQNTIDPKGVVWIRNTLQVFTSLEAQLLNLKTSTPVWNEIYSEYLLKASPIKLLIEQLLQAFVDDPPTLFGKGGKIFCDTYSPELDEIIKLEQNFDLLLSELEKKERDNSQISTLKIGFTRVFGYYFEVSKGKVAQVPKHFIRKQTLTNGERYTTDELKTLEERSLSAAERRLTLERELFEQLRQQILLQVTEIIEVSKFIARFDVLHNFANLAITHKFTFPTVTQQAVTFLVNSVHPILKSLQANGEEFVANTIAVGTISALPETEIQLLPPELLANDANCLLITGPNMAGKSTIMRQVALAQILCQIGSFVPASFAIIGVCDRILTRIGSSDFALKNQSTFMVEMLEAAQILRSASKQSLLLLDELGRGTSTYDGLSLAWAIIEDIHNRIGARTLFSTHYHELLEVTNTCKSIIPMQMEVIERDKRECGKAGLREILFSRRFILGAAGKSYGLHVAELAGISPKIIMRATEILENLANKQLRQKNVIKVKNATATLSIFDFADTNQNQASTGV